MREIFLLFQGDFSKMYRIYKKIPNSFQGDFEFCSKSGAFERNFYKFHSSFPGVSLMMREVSHV